LEFFQKEFQSPFFPSNFQGPKHVVFEKLTISPKFVGYLGFGGKNVKVFQDSKTMVTFCLDLKL